MNSAFSGTTKSTEDGANGSSSAFGRGNMSTTSFLAPSLLTPAGGTLPGYLPPNSMPGAPPNLPKVDGALPLGEDGAAALPVQPPGASGELNKAVFMTNGVVHDLPKSMLTDQFGIAAFVVGQLQRFTHHAPFPDSVVDQVMKDMDYSKYCSCFQNPTEPRAVSETPPQPIPEYMISERLAKGEGAKPNESGLSQIRKLHELQGDKLGDDLYFYWFYTFTQDALQLTAAGHLYRRGWRYHKVGQIWLQPIMGTPYHKDGANGQSERGMYRYFDHRIWKVVRSEFTLKLSDIEGPPSAAH